MDQDRLTLERFAVGEKVRLRPDHAVMVRRPPEKLAITFTILKKLPDESGSETRYHIGHEDEPHIRCVTAGEIEPAK